MPTNDKWNMTWIVAVMICRSEEEADRGQQSLLLVDTLDPSIVPSTSCVVARYSCHERS